MTVAASDPPPEPAPEPTGLRVWPAVDLMGGDAVQLEGGDPDRVLARRDDPADVVRGFAADGAWGIHVVDLDRALDRGDNEAALADVLAAADEAGIDVQVAGGLRDRDAVEAVLAADAARAVVGTRALEDPAWFADLAAAHPDRVVLALDVRGDEVQTHGWTQGAGFHLDDAVQRLVEGPGRDVAAVLCTHVDREGRQAGADAAFFARLADLLAPHGVPLVASGGVATLDDLDALAGAGVAEAVLGSALYTGKLTLKEVLDHVRTRP